MGNFSTPGGQNADILRATINGESYGEPPTSEISELLIELNQLIIAGGGGGGGTTNYNGLTNKPQINGVELKNNKTLADLGIVIPEVDSALSGSSENPVQNRIIKGALDGKQNLLTFDAAPTAGSNNPVRSSGIKTALDLKQDVLTIDPAISESSTNPVQNRAIALKLADYYTKDQIDDIVAALETLKLEPVAELPTQDISTTTIYLLETETPGKYEQYLYLNNTWVLLGSTDVDLSNYYNKSQVDTLLLTKQAVLTFDNAPTNGSNNPVKSGGIYTALQGKQDTLTFDNAPTEDSDNPVKSGGVYAALENKQDTLTFDNAPTEDSDNPVKSGGVYAALEEKQDTLTFDNEPVINSSNPVKSGGVYSGLIKKLEKTNTMPAASADLLNTQLLFVGTTTSDYTKGTIYECQLVPESDPAAYHWVAISSAEIDLSLYKKIWGPGPKSEWDALSTAEKTQYDEAHFNDDEDPAYTVVDEVTKGNMHAVSSNAVAEAIEDVYSTTEIKTNKVWTDGKPIYRKIFNVGALPNINTKAIDLDITNLDYATNLYGTCKRDSDSAFLPLPYLHPANLSEQIALYLRLGQIIITTGQDRSAFSGYVTLEYTKTTD